MEAKARQGTWYQNAIIYQTHVRAFYDGNGDGIGDFLGLTERLDYLKELGVTAIWLLPFFPSPLKDDGYDISDYKSVNPIYGSLEDFQNFTKKAQLLGLHVIIELVLNHTSDQHPWFQRARHAERDSCERHFYVWSDTTDRYGDARIIFKDFEASNWSWDPIAKAYFWHRFYSHQPDLNFENLAVHKEIFDIIDFWMSMNVSGLRLDAVPYLFEQEGTNCENLPATHDFLKKVRAYMEERYPGCMLLAEANQWPEDTALYFGRGDECHMCFHFPLMPRIFMALEMEDRFPIIDILGQTPPIPNDCQWAIFLRNHDELTLEMVTEEDRDYIWRVYAKDSRAKINLGIRRRLAALLGNNRRKIELLVSLLFSLPGTPVLYYGDEIGMGDNIYLGDRNGVRTPLQWSSDRNAGFSRANPQQLYLPVIIDHEFHYEAVNIETQERNPNSLLWWTKRIIAIRKSSRALSLGTIKMLHPNNPKVLCFFREEGEELCLIVANMSRNVQCVEVSLPNLNGRIPVEMFGHTRFPPISQSKLTLSLGAHQFLWFRLEEAQHEEGRDLPLPKVRMREDTQRAELRLDLHDLEGALPRYLARAHWFSKPYARIRSVDVRQLVSLSLATGDVIECLWTSFSVEYHEGESELFAIPFCAKRGPLPEADGEQEASNIVAQLTTSRGAAVGYLCDALGIPFFRTQLPLLAKALREPSRRRPEIRYVSVQPLPADLPAFETQDCTLPPSNSEHRHAHATLAYGSDLVIKLFRRAEEGVNHEVEIGRHLARGTPACSVPTMYGYFELLRRDEPPIIVGIVQNYLPNKRNLWSYTRDVVARFLEAALSSEIKEADAHTEECVIREAAKSLLGPFVPELELLGRRLAEFHLALASGVDSGEFKPEPFTDLDKQSLFQSARQKLARVAERLREAAPLWTEEQRQIATKIVGDIPTLERQLRTIAFRKELLGKRIRVHGDLELRQILYTGKDFAFTIFDGDPSESNSLRRIKQPPTKDIASIARSLWLAAFETLNSPLFRDEDKAKLSRWKAVFFSIALDSLTEGYRTMTVQNEIIELGEASFSTFLSFHLLDELLDEVLREFNTSNLPPRSLIALHELLAAGEGWTATGALHRSPRREGPP